MNTKESLLKKREELAINILKYEYSFIFDQMIAESRTELEDWLKQSTQDRLTDLANDGIHEECIDSHHHSISASVDFDETKSVIDDYQHGMDLIEEIYKEGNK